MQRLFPILAFIFIIHLPPSSCLQYPAVFGNYVTDLYNKDASSQGTLASQWILTGLSNPAPSIISLCNGDYLLGNANLFSTSGGAFSRTYSSFDSHESIRFYLKFYLVGTVNAGDEVQVSIDSHSSSISVYSSVTGSSTFSCSTPWVIVGTAPHTASSVTLKIRPMLASSYIAFRDVVLLIDGSIVTMMSACLKFNSGPPYTPDGACSCKITGTYSSAGSCLPCSGSCGGCFDAPDKCYSCRGTSWSGSTCATNPSGINCKFYVPNHGCLYCSTGYVVAPDLTCQTFCPAGYQLNTVGDYSVCEAIPPTTPTLCESDPAKPYYFTEDQTCVESCEYPFVIQGEDICALGISAEEAKSIANKASLQNTVSDVLGGFSVASYLLSFADPSGACLSNALKLLPYMKFMKIAFPPRLYLLLSLQKTDQGSTKFVPSPSYSIIKGFDYYQIPYRFAKFKLHSSFLVNFWSYLMTMLIILGGVLIVFFLDFSTKSLKSVNSATSAVKQAVKWNFTIMFFLGYFDLLIIFTSLEMRTLHLDTFLSSLSFVICIAVNIAAIIVVYKSFQVIFALQKLKKLGANDTKGGAGISQYEILFKISKDATYSQHLFMAVFIIRTYLFCIVIGYFFDHPLVQAILIILLNLAMLLYLIIKTPLKLKVKLAQFIFQELMVFVVNLCILILACLDEAESESADLRANLGDFIIMTNIVYNFLAIIFIVLVGGVSIYQAYQDHKNSKSKGNLQEGNMRNDQNALKIHKPRDHFVGHRGGGGDFISPSPQIKNFQPQQYSTNIQGNNSSILNMYDSSPQRPLDHHGDFMGYHQNYPQRGRKISETQTIDNSFTLNGSQLPLNIDEWNGGYNESSPGPVGEFQSAHIVARKGSSKGMYTKEARQFRRNLNASRR